MNKDELNLGGILNDCGDGVKEHTQLGCLLYAHKSNRAVRAEPVTVGLGATHTAGFEV
jgi:hypothetical protein